MLPRTLRRYSGSEQRGVTSTAPTPSAAAEWNAAPTDVDFGRRRSRSDNEVAERFSRLKSGQLAEAILRTTAVVGELIEGVRRHEATAQA